MSIDPPQAPFAHLGGYLATDLVEIADLTADPGALDRGGWWAVLATFEGMLTGYRFAEVRSTPLPAAGAPWRGPDPADWRSSLDRAGYLTGVHAIRRLIEAGDVYQVNLCRLLSAPLPGDADPLALAEVLAAGNPAPYQGLLMLGATWVLSASPELFLALDGDVITSAPIKGTTGPGEPFADKDFPENIMITDLVRNDLGRIGRPGSVRVTELLAREEHPGLAHLVSTVTARLAAGIGWAEILAATFPPGSVTGAPKIRAQQVISQLEPVQRGPYCGAIGYVDADARRARLAVGIRTFFTTSAFTTGPFTSSDFTSSDFTSSDPANDRRAPVPDVEQPENSGTTVHFGTGAGITYSSDPESEWAETVLKAARLIALASRPSMPDPDRSAR